MELSVKLEGEGKESAIWIALRKGLILILLSDVRIYIKTSGNHRCFDVHC